MNNILVVNVNWLGDAIFSTPVFKVLKKTYPHARITCLCVPRVKDVMDHCAYVDHIIIYDERGKHRMPWDKLALILNLRAQHFDAVFLLHKSMTRAMMMWLAGIPKRIGSSKSKIFLTHPLPWPDENLHRSDAYLSVVEGYGLKVDDRLCELRLRLEEMQSVDEKLLKFGIKEAEDFVVLNPGGNWDLKRWPSENFALLAQRIIDELGVRVVFSGASLDKGYCQEIIRMAQRPAVVMAGETTLGESLVLYKRARVVVSSDSGPLHLAHSVGSHVIGIFGPTSPSITGPRGGGSAQICFKEIECNKAPCYHLKCQNNLCMKAITVDNVIQIIKEILC